MPQPLSHEPTDHLPLKRLSRRSYRKMSSIFVTLFRLSPEEATNPKWNPKARLAPNRYCCRCQMTEKQKRYLKNQVSGCPILNRLTKSGHVSTLSNSHTSQISNKIEKPNRQLGDPSLNGQTKMYNIDSMTMS